MWKYYISFILRNIGQEDKAKEPEAEDESSATPDKNKDDHPTPTKGKGKGVDKGRSSVEAKVDRKRSADKKKQIRRNSQQTISPPPGHGTPVSEGDNLR